MLRYLRAAFWFRIPLPGLGRMPVNALAVLGLAILGFGHPAFWLLGLGLEGAYLGFLASHPRFQRWIEASAKSTAEQDAALAARLSPRAQVRLQELERKCARVLALYRETKTDDFVLSSNRDALERLAAIYRQLLASRGELEANRTQATEAELRRRIGALERDLASPGTSGALRDSQAATLKLVRQRLGNLGRSAEAQREIDSDLERIEAQVDLTLESAGLPGRNDLAAANIELASQLLAEGIGTDPALAELGVEPSSGRNATVAETTPPPPPAQPDPQRSLDR